MMYLLLNLTSNKMDKIYLLIYRSASHLFSAKVSVLFREEKAVLKNDGFNLYYRPWDVLTSARGRQVADAWRQTTNHMRINSLLT